MHFVYNKNILTIPNLNRILISNSNKPTGACNVSIVSYVKAALATTA